MSKPSGAGKQTRCRAALDGLAAAASRSGYAGFSCCLEGQALSTHQAYPLGPLTVNSSRLDSFLPSAVQTAPSALQSVVTGRTMVTSAAE